MKLWDPKGASELMTYGTETGDPGDFGAVE